MTKSHGLELLDAAAGQFDRLRLLPIDAVELAQVNSLRATARSAMDWLEDTGDFESAHALLDKIGNFVRESVPDACLLGFEEGTYYNSCPVSLAHSRVGFSVGFVIRKMECGICGADPWDCEHISGETYDGLTCRRVITEAEMLEVSLVARPAQPDARIMKASIDTADMREALGASFEIGMKILCDRCLKPCDGVSRALETKYPM